MTDIHERLKEEVLRNYDAGRTQLCRADYENILRWEFNSTLLTPERSYELVEEGWREFRGMGRRYQQAFPTLLPSTYERNHFFFRSTHTDRARQSLFAFTEGLFGENSFHNVTFEPVPDVDPLLRVICTVNSQNSSLKVFNLQPNNFCPLYTQVGSNLVEQTAFETGPEWEQMLEQVNRKLGFFGSNQLSSRDVRTVWDFCKFEQGWNPGAISPWCAAFSIANHEVLEYFEDLE